MGLYVSAQFITPYRRLSTILGAKRIKVSDVCRATGIARATVDRYYNDSVNSFDRKVLSSLCDFLQVKPGDLLVLVKQDDLFSMSDEELEKQND
jgi:putative transcriptional regulator